MNQKEIPVTKIHSYNVSVAVDVGINAAIIFHNICFWVEQNFANERNFINGDYWTYNTVNAFKTMFPEMTYEQIRNALRKLEDKKYIKSAFLSEDAMDRTKYYAVVNFEKWISNNKCKCENSQMGCDDSQMECENSQMYNIYNNINNNSNNKHTDNSHNSKANSFFAKKVRENKNKSRIDQSELEKRISNVIDDLRIDVFSDDQADSVESFMLYFIDRYAEIFGKKHPLLKENTIDDIAASVTRQICIEHENMEFDTYFEPLISDEAGETYYEEIVDMYFKTEFKQDVDYSMVHFSQKNVLVKLMGKATNKVWYQNS